MIIPPDSFGSAVTGSAVEDETYRTAKAQAAEVFSTIRADSCKKSFQAHMAERQIMGLQNLVTAMSRTTSRPGREILLSHPQALNLMKPLSWTLLGELAILVIGGSPDCPHRTKRSIQLRVRRCFIGVT